MPEPADFNTLKDMTLLSIGRTGKNLFFNFDGTSSAVLVSHLGMSGSYRISSFWTGRDQPHKHDILELVLTDNDQEKWVVTYNDVRRFGMLSILNPEFMPVVEQLGLGPDALRLTGRLWTMELRARSGNFKNQPIKELLMNQSFVAGLGNIYASEVCHLAEIHPSALSANLSLRQWGGVTSAISLILPAAIAKGGTTIEGVANRYQSASGKEGSYWQQLQVYGREKGPCLRPKCGGIISMYRLSGRATYFCPQCQPK